LHRFTGNKQKETSMKENRFVTFIIQAL